MTLLMTTITALLCISCRILAVIIQYILKGFNIFQVELLENKYFIPRYFITMLRLTSDIITFFI